MKKGNIEYIAIPYTSVDKKVRKFRINVSDYFYAKLMAEGHIVYAPISHNGRVAEKYKLPKEWKFWKRIDSEFLRVSKKLWVVRLDGWKTSIGVQEEIRIAKKLKIPIEYLDYESESEKNI